MSAVSCELEALSHGRQLRWRQASKKPMRVVPIEVHKRNSEAAAQHMALHVCQKVLGRGRHSSWRQVS